MVVNKTKKNYRQERKTRKNKIQFKNKNKTKTKKRNRYRRTKKVYYGGNPNNYMNIIQNYKKKPSSISKNNYYDLPIGTKIYAFADVHGDFKLLVKLLELSGVMKQNVKLPTIKTEDMKDMKCMYDVSDMQDYFNGLEWTGDSNYVVQIGDQIDRTRDVIEHKSFEDEGSTFEIVYLLLKLNELAIEHNKNRDPNYKSGQKYVFSMLGNHEIMNVQGDLRYCSLAEFKVFARRLNSDAQKTGHSDAQNTGHSDAQKNTCLRNSIKRVYVYGDNDDEESVSYHRKKAYRPGGIMANLMSKHYHTLLHIGPFLFVHGGLPFNIASNYSLDEINSIVSEYLRDTLPVKDNKSLRNIINGDRSLLWNREMSQDSHREMEKKSKDSSTSGDIPILTQLRKIMEIYMKKNEKRYNPQVLCVGHTPQFFVKEDANLLVTEPEKQSSNNQKNYQLKPNTNDVLRLDTGSSRAFGKESETSHRRPQIAELSMNNDGSINVVIKS
jgi:hypothetical protein